MKKIYVDAETTGTDPQRHGLIQWSARIIINGDIKRNINLRIRPFPEDIIEEDALEVNGLGPLDMADQTRLAPAEAYKQIVANLEPFVDKYDKKDKMIWLGFRAGFDSDFTRQFFHKNGDTYFGAWFFTPPLCVMTLAAYLLQKERHRMENFKLRTVYNHLHPHMVDHWKDDDWHDSMFDIARTIDIEDALRRKVAPRPSMPPPDPHQAAHMEAASR